MTTSYDAILIGSGTGYTQILQVFPNPLAILSG